MARRGDADRSALHGDEAIHRVDLGTPAFQDVLCHRRALDVAPRIRDGLWNERRLDFLQRRAVALRGARDALRIQALHLLELIAERLSNPDRLTREPDLETADLRVAQAVAGGQAGRRGHAVAHAVLHELRPTLA